MPILDGWRAVAIILVLAFHGLYNSTIFPTSPVHIIAELSGRLGAMGVLIFFCISGYLITTKLLQESRSTGKFSIRNFYIKRSFRILPPLAVYLFTLIILSEIGILSLQAGDWAAPFFLANYIHGSWYTSHFWSLSVEEHFYLFWPACTLIAGFRKSIWVGLTVVIAVAIWRSWELRFLIAHGYQSHVAFTLQHTDMRLDYIMMGCVSALAFNFHPRVGAFVAKLGSPLGLLCLLIALTITTLHLPFDVRSLQATILTLMVCGTSLSNSPLLNKLLANPMMLFIGRISYSVYIWQQLFLGRSSNPMISSPRALPVKYVLVIAVACASYYLVEKPFIRYGRSLLTRNQRSVS